jgi:translation initiation factor IF-3
LIDEEGKMIGVVSSHEALAIAKDRGYDLVEISPNADPPVCKVLDFGKYKYELSKKLKESKKKQHIQHLKELKIRPRTEIHDYNFKMRHGREFLEKGDKVKITVVFRGREMAHLDFGKTLLDRMRDDLVDVGEIETDAKREGRNMFSIFVPKRKGGTKKIKDKNEKDVNEKDKKVTDKEEVKPDAKNENK